MSEGLMTKVQDLIDNMINPAVAGHGGFVQLVDVTLKQGIERLIREELPEVEEVLDTTDHASGENPYYQPSK
jgi:Fe/S biogenesis protein NfuA